MPSSQDYCFTGGETERAGEESSSTGTDPKAQPALPNPHEVTCYNSVPSSWNLASPTGHSPANILLNGRPKHSLPKAIHKPQPGKWQEVCWRRVTRKVIAPHVSGFYLLTHPCHHCVLEPLSRPAVHSGHLLGIPFYNRHFTLCGQA